MFVFSSCVPQPPQQWGSLRAEAVGHVGSPQWGDAGTEQELGEVPPTHGGCGVEMRSLGSSARECKHHSCTSSFTDLGSCYKVKCTTLPSNFPTLENISRSFLLLRTHLISFLPPPEALIQSLWLQYSAIFSFKTIVYHFLDL